MPLSINDGKFSHIADVYTEALNVCMDRCGKPPELPILTLPDINTRIWGFKRRKLNIIAGRPSQGKSSVMLQLAVDLALQGKTVLFFTYEMTTQVCVERAISNWCEVDSFDLLSGKIAEKIEQHQEEMNAFYTKLQNSKLIIIEGFGKTFDQLMEAVESFKAPIDAVFVDYVQMITPERGENKKEGLDRYLRSLREYAVTKDFCAIVASQINRGTHEGHKVREPELWELKGSGELEEIADMCWLCSWEYKYTYDEDTKNAYVINIAKNRDGRTGRVELIYQPEYFKIREALYVPAGKSEEERSFGIYHAQD